MAATSSASTQGGNLLLVRNLDGKSRAFTLERDSLTGRDILTLVYGTVTESLLYHLRVCSGLRQIDGETVIRAGSNGLFESCTILGRLRGGKGGFGSLLRGSGAAQKKTTNFDACRDMSGRRMRHVNAEKKLKEWRQEASERKLEKVAQDYIKKLARDKKQEAQEAAVAGSIKEISHETMDRVAEAVKLGMQKSKLSDLDKKRKRDVPGEDRKGKGELGAWSDVAPGLAVLEEDEEESEEEQDSEDEEEEEEGDEGEDRDTRAGGSGGAGPSKGSRAVGLTVPEVQQSQSKDTVSDGPSSSKRPRPDDSARALPELVQNGKEATTIGSDSSPSASSLSDHKSGSASPEAPSAATRGPAPGSSDGKSAQPAKADAKTPPPDGPLDWTKIASAADLEAFGLEWLKAELTKSGLKCGGTLQERAARLFLLKDTPLNKVDRKHLARPPLKKA